MSQPTARVATDLGVGAGVGAFSGVFGVGGGILLVPFLVLARQVPQKQAQATSLVMIAMAAVAGLIVYALDGAVAWVAGAFLAAGGLVGAWVGAHAVQRSPSGVLQAGFGALLVIAGVRLLWFSPATAESAAQLPDPSLGTAAGYVIAGLAMGVLSALFGVGGGILLIPILVAFFDYGQHLAAGTSLAVMVPIALVGALRLTRPGYTRWGEGARYGAGSIVGAPVGAALALLLSAAVLQVAFGVLLLVVGAQMGLRAWRGRRHG